MTRRQVGALAELQASYYLRSLGYKIIRRNFTIRGGEIDIIAMEGTELVFVEVKARHSRRFGTAIESITPRKTRALVKTAQVFLQRMGWGQRPYRFDLITLDFDQELVPKLEQLSHFIV